MTPENSLDFIIRTEDLRADKALELYVPTERDEQLVQLLAAKTPLIIEGSRGTGKTLLLRVCEQRQLSAFKDDHVLPVYISFNKSSLLNTPSPQQFLHWMLSRLCSAVLRAIQRQGLSVSASPAARVLTGGTQRDGEAGEKTALEKIAEAFESSYKASGQVVDGASVPTVEAFRDAIQDLCESLRIERFNVLFDEAAHIFRPEQQRQFFTLFRDLRSSYMTCNAAVYPGVTAYGGVFETTHDARIELLNRDINSPLYLSQMREIVLRQADSTLRKEIERNGENFDALAFAVSGNPRLLLKTVALAGRLNSGSVQSVLKEFFRGGVWAEHTSLSERYPGHKALIDWGRRFLESWVIPEITKRNESAQIDGRTERTAMLWLQKDVSEAAKESVRLLTYTGILSKVDDGVVGTRSQIGSRYLVNIGCLVASASNPVANILDLRKGLALKRFVEVGPSQPMITSLSQNVGKFVEADASLSLATLLNKSIFALDLTDYQKTALHTIDLHTIGQALQASEAEFQRVKWIGPVRSRQMMNVVTAAALEYLSG